MDKSELTVEQLRDAQYTLAENIKREISRLIGQFHEDFGVDPSHIDIKIIDTGRGLDPNFSRFVIAVVDLDFSHLLK
jgi:hypothetical protein